MTSKAARKPQHQPIPELKEALALPDKKRRKGRNVHHHITAAQQREGGWPNYACKDSH